MKIDQDMQWRKRTRGALMICVHITGVLCAALALALCTGGMQGAAIVAGEWATQRPEELVSHLLLAGLAWGAAAQGWRMMRRRGEARVLRAARGTVVTETLIVLAPFMLLTSGLAQMSINNMAGMLTNKAAYEAGRTMWVWEPTDRNAGQRRARLAAAASVAPVAPGSNLMLGMGGDQELQALRGTMYATYSPLGWVGGGSGVSKTLAGVQAVGGESSLTGLSFNNAFDDDSFPRRAARKLTFAYLATTIQPRTGAEVGATVSYRHFQAFPWFGWITGRREFSGPGMRPGYYLTITRTYTIPAQVR